MRDESILKHQKTTLQRTNANMDAKSNKPGRQSKRSCGTLCVRSNELHMPGWTWPGGLPLHSARCDKLGQLMRHVLLETRNLKPDAATRRCEAQTLQQRHHSDLSCQKRQNQNAALRNAPKAPKPNRPHDKTRQAPSNCKSKGRT